MDINHQTKFPNHSWNFEISHMEAENILMNTSSWTCNFPLQNLQILPPSNNPSTQIGQIPFTSTVGGDQNGVNPEVAVEEAEAEVEEELGAMKEMMYKIASMQPVDIDPATIRKPKRRNVRISDDPQSVAARHRRERISEKIRILQRLVPGGTKMDTASMLDEAIRYVKFLKRQIRLLQSSSSNHQPQCSSLDWSKWPAAPSKPPPLGSYSPNSSQPFAPRKYNVNNDNDFGFSFN